MLRYYEIRIQIQSVQGLLHSDSPSISPTCTQIPFPPGRWIRSSTSDMVLHILFGILTGMRSLILPDTPKMSKTWVISYLNRAHASVAKMQQFHCGLWKKLPSLHLWLPSRHSYEENIVYSSVSPVKSITVIHCSGLSLQSTWKMNRTSGLDRVLQDMNPCFNKIRSALSTATENQKLIHKASNGTTLSANCHCCCRNAGTPLCNLEAALAASSSWPSLHRLRTQRHRLFMGEVLTSSYMFPPR